MEQEGRKTRVYHAVRPSFRAEDTISKLLRMDFELVAEVDTDDPVKAFGLTNTGDVEWFRNDRVLALAGPCRSTSVGDILILPDGRKVLVLRIGFLELVTW